MIKLILPGSIRSKKNSKKIIAYPRQKKGNNKHFWSKIGWNYCYHRIQPSDAYGKWEDEARRFVWREGPDSITEKPLEGLLHVKALIYYKGRMPDLSGAMESVGDCLEGIAWKDDSQIRSWDGSRLIHDLKNPRTEVYVSPWAESDEEKLQRQVQVQDILF